MVYGAGSGFQRRSLGRPGGSVGLNRSQCAGMFAPPAEWHQVTTVTKAAGQLSLLLSSVRQHTPTVSEGTSSRVYAVRHAD